MDVILVKDLEVYVAVEIVVYIGLVYVFGEIFINVYVDINCVVCDIIVEIGYINIEYGFFVEIVGVYLFLVE